MKGLLRTIIEIHKEQALRHKALRLLAKQQWSVEFLSALVAEAARQLEKNVVITVENVDGHKIHISSTTDSGKLNYSDSIFDKLDDEAAIDSFIAKHSTR